MKRYGIALAALALAACNGEKPADPAPAAATPPAPVYQQSWFTGGDAAPSLELHETQYGLHGRLVDPLGKSYPVRAISRTETGLSFTVPSLDAVWNATKTPEGAYAGKWEQIGYPAEDVVLSPSLAPESMPPPPDGSGTRFVSLPDGRQMFLNCIGSGSPAVIFDSGAGSTSSAWHGVWQETGKSTLACTYDRAGLGLSDPGPLPRDATAVANDIDALLTAAKIPGPYILVGHSLGSYHIRQFANTRFDKMAGMVLVDPSGDGQEARFMAAIPKAFASSKAQMDAMKSLNCVANLRAKLVAKADKLAQDCLGNDADIIESYLSEVDAMAGPSTDQLTKSRRQWGAMPLIVLTRGDYDKEMPPTFSKADREGMKTVWVAMHEEMTALSTTGKHVTVPGAGHGIQRDKPQAVIDAVAEVLAAARANKP